MTIEAFEQDRRRAEVSGKVVTFIRISGNVRLSHQPVFWNEYASERRARYLAKRWVKHAKLGKPVLQ
jgi:hypothetical protein